MARSTNSKRVQNSRNFQKFAHNFHQQQHFRDPQLSRQQNITTPTSPKGNDELLNNTDHLGGLENNIELVRHKLLNEEGTKRKPNPKPSEHIRTTSSQSKIRAIQFQLKDLKKVNGNKYPIDIFERVALFQIQDDNQLEYVGIGNRSNDACEDDEIIVVEIVELDTKLSSEFKLLHKYDWPKVHLCKFFHYSSTKLSLTGLEQTQDNFSMKELEPNVGETLKQLREQLTVCEMELKKTKAALNEANARIEQFESKSNLNYEKNMQKVWMAVDVLVKSKRKIKKTSDNRNNTKK